jgi:hypothetical protein
MNKGPEKQRDQTTYHKNTTPFYIRYTAARRQLGRKGGGKDGFIKVQGGSGKGRASSIAQSLEESKKEKEEKRAPLIV